MSNLIYLQQATFETHNKQYRSMPTILSIFLQLNETGQDAALAFKKISQ